MADWTELRGSLEARLAEVRERPAAAALVGAGLLAGVVLLVLFVRWVAPAVPARWQPAPAWDVEAAAGTFALLAGLLAGFVMIAAVTLLALPRAGAAPPAVVPLLTAFFTLLVAAFLFAVLAGGRGTGTSLAGQAVAACLGWLVAVAMVECAAALRLLLAGAQEAGARAFDAAGAAAAGLGAAVITLPLWALHPAQRGRDAFAFAVVFAIALLGLPLGRRLRQLASPALHLDRVTVASLWALLAAVAVAGVVAAAGEAWTRAQYGWAFALLVLLQAVLAGLLAAHEAALYEPPVPPGVPGPMRPVPAPPPPGVAPPPARPVGRVEPPRWENAEGDPPIGRPGEPA